MVKLLNRLWRKYIVLLVVKTVVYFLSFDLGGKLLGVTKAVGEYISSEAEVLPLTRRDIKPKRTWIEILDESEKQNKTIKPIKHRKNPPPKNLFCPDCGAPPEYIYNDAILKSGQKYLCKLCGRQWAPERLRNNLTLYCPYCRTALVEKKKREDFDILKCPNPHCFHKLKTHARYAFRLYHFPLEKLKASIPERAPLDFSLIKFSETAVAYSLTLRVCYGLSTRACSRAMWDFFGLKISHNTVADWHEALAYLLHPITNSIPLNASSTWIIDDTVRKYKGKKGYLFAVIDDDGKLLAFHFSKKRNVLAVVTVLLAAIARTGGQTPSLIVTDAFSTYGLAFWLVSHLLGNISFVHQKVKGLKDQPGYQNPYRYLKNMIERFFGTSRFYAKLYRGFKSFNAVVTHSFLFGVFYNFLRVHSRYDLPPVYLQEIYDGNNVHGWTNLIRLALKNIAP